MCAMFIFIAYNYDA